jgi:hypothetical protein
MTTGVSTATVVFPDDFESPTASTMHTLADTSGTANTTEGVRGTSGFGASKNGIVREARVGETFVDLVGSQAYGFRCNLNAGLTSAFGQIGNLAVGQAINFSFQVTAIKLGRNELRASLESRQGRPESSRGCRETEPPESWHWGFCGQGGDSATHSAPAAARRRHGRCSASAVHVRSGHFRSPPGGWHISTPGSAALHPWLRSGHPSRG